MSYLVAVAVLCMGFGVWSAYGELSLEPVLTDLDTPWDVAFGDEWMYVTTRPGILYGVHEGETIPLLHMRVSGGEGGMLGVATHGGMVYVYYTDINNGNRVSRYTHTEDGLKHDIDIIQDIPSAAIHNGGRIRFGPDAMLYVTTGDAGNPNHSQDVNSLAGKILRLNPDGTIPADNPVPGSPVYAYGLRNPQGITWDTNNTMYVTDHGPSGLFENAHDEINQIIPYGNYGWPDSVGDRVTSGTIAPLIHSGAVTWAPSGLEFINGSGMLEWEGMLLYGALRGAHLGTVNIDGSGHATYLDGEMGRIRAPIQHPNGTVYVITSNTDGRGLPYEGHDMLLRVTFDMSIPDKYEYLADILWSMYRDGHLTVQQLHVALGYVSSLS